ncbi:hypothetical protein Sme01_25500 [Sphaerisporangium melleum]|uniref:Uncharacterized protein n=1 Tax=Sphaerisporangium melleum TaxID=321316 RepID=A0A917VCL9_9ACTN|nr:hypothetical protein [Sphaerisporangium melleum]GGK64474.1 hypothetical protein GCM10007964_04430 [Sphaerisporangium melleum]GII70074.1 hypothetical protein Sme01_25500 [Sphaerisporangium melleum]
MTTTESASARHLIERAARGHYRTVYTPSALDAAAQLLADLHATGARHGIAPGDWAGEHGGDQRLAEAVLLAQVTAYRNASLADLPDPYALLSEAAARAGLAVLDRAGEDDTERPPPRVPPARAFVRLARLPRTPHWGWDGTAPLVVSLERFDSLTSPAWKWELFPDLGEPSTQMVQVVAPPPSPAVADEVFAVAQRVLTGALPLYR